MKKIIFAFLLLWAPVLALDLPEPQWYVNDFANILTTEQIQGLESNLTVFHQQTSTELAVVILPALDGEDISMLATEIGQKRWVGDEQYDRWLLLLVAPNDREWFIAVWYGLEWTIPDAIAKRIGERHFPVYFPDGDYFGGISAALKDIQSYIQADPTVVEEYNTSEDLTMQENIGVGFFFLLVFLLVLFLMVKSKRLYWAIAWVGIVVLITVLSSLLVLGLFFGTFIRIMVAASIFGKRGGGFGGMWSSWWFGWSSGWFGGFGGGSFGGGGAGGRR